MTISEVGIQILLWTFGAVVGGLGTFLAEKRLQERKVLAWSVVTQINISDKALSGSGSAIEILVGGQKVTNLSLVTIRVENKGNKEIKNVKNLTFSFGNSAKIYQSKVLAPGRFGSTITVDYSGNSAETSLEFINTRQSFQIEFLVDGYNTDKVEAELLMPGVTLKKDQGDNSPRSILVISFLLIIIIVLLVVLLIVS